VAIAVLTWHHTEFGRRTDCGTFRIVHQGGGWQLLDADWNPLGAASSIPAAQQLAERLHARATAAARRASVCTLERRRPRAARARSAEVER
jgi:hypothetical protein